MWQQINPYYLTNNNWTITKANGTKYQYGLYEGAILHGCFEKLEEAKSKYDELVDIK